MGVVCFILCAGGPARVTSPRPLQRRGDVICPVRVPPPLIGQKQLRSFVRSPSLAGVELLIACPARGCHGSARLTMTT